jgi:hypothetical protein
MEAAVRTVAGAAPSDQLAVVGERSATSSRTGSRNVRHRAGPDRSSSWLVNTRPGFAQGRTAAQRFRRSGMVPVGERGARASLTMGRTQAVPLMSTSLCPRKVSCIAQTRSEAAEVSAQAARRSSLLRPSRAVTEPPLQRVTGAMWHPVAQNYALAICVAEWTAEHVRRRRERIDEHRGSVSLVLPPRSRCIEAFRPSRCAFGCGERHLSATT